MGWTDWITGRRSPNGRGASGNGRNDARNDTRHSGFFPLEDAPGDGWNDSLRFRSGTTNRATTPDYDAWDRRLDQVDRRFGQASLDAARRWWRPRDWVRGRSKWWWAKRLSLSVLVTFILLVGWLAITAPLGKSLEPIAPPQLTLLAADGTPIARKGAMMGEPVEVAELPGHVIEPFLAIEDRRFYSHWGIDPRGIARAAWTGYGGGSTITQQLAKFTFLTPERSLTRKAREMLIAFWLEAWLTKDEILERYLSNAYFGDNVYGLRAASLHFFHRKPENLLPQQAAMLAGLVQAPSRYNPARHFERAEQRRQVVVGAMVAAGYLTQAQADAMPRPVLDIRTSREVPTGTYFADWALPEARKRAETGYASLTIATTLDARLQQLASRAVASAPLGEAQVALVAMRPTGEVVAMIGGKDYASSPFNRATQAKRQPGSTFKLFVYLAALREGLEPEDRIDNSAIEQGSYRPKNAKENYSDSLSLEEAFARSSNVAAVRLWQRVGDEAVIDTARDLGIESPLAEGDPSLALGTSTLTLLELTAAYAGVAANRFPVEPHAFQQEEPGWFDWLWDSKGAFSRATHSEMESMLRRAINQGTGRAATLPTPNYGKTGTSQNNRDALFVGYAGEGEDRLVVGVWIGNDDNSPLDGISGGGLPARIWRDFMRRAQGLDDRRAPPPIPRADPSGPVEPLDVPELDDIPLGDGRSRMRIDGDNGVTIETELEDIPLDIVIDEGGLRVEEGRRQNGREPAR